MVNEDLIDQNESKLKFHNCGVETRIRMLKRDHPMVQSQQNSILNESFIDSSISKKRPRLHANDSNSFS